jgi:hypothetical protein
MALRRKCTTASPRLAHSGRAAKAPASKEKEELVVGGSVLSFAMMVAVISLSLFLLFV